MSELWVHNPGAESEYGPVTLVQLRALMNAGLIFETTRVRDAFSEAKEIPAWPELAEALADERLKEWRPGGLVMNRAGWQAGPAPDSAPSASPAGGASALKLGRAIFTPVSDADRGTEALEVLAINRAYEPDREIKMPPWWRSPLVRNLVRYFGVVGPVTGFSVWYWKSHGLSFMSELPIYEVGITAVNAMVIAGWGWFVWWVAPDNWNSR